MDDEEDDMSRPVSQLWGTPFRDVKFQERAIQITGEDFTAMPAPQEHSTNVASCSFRWQPRMPFYGNAGLRSHFPAQFEPTEDRGPRQIEEEEEEEEHRGQQNEGLAERPEERPEVSVEVQIGQKLREIGDKFNQDHVEVFMRHQRQNIPVWMRLTMALFGFLFPREALVPRLRGELR